MTMRLERLKSNWINKKLKDTPSQLQSGEIRRLGENDGNNDESQQVEHYQKCIKPIKKDGRRTFCTGWGGRRKKVKKCGTNDQLRWHWCKKSKTYLETLVEVMKKDKLPKAQNLRKSNKMRLKEKTKLVEYVIHIVHAGNITVKTKLIKCRALFIFQLLGINNKENEEPFWKRRTESNTNVLWNWKMGGKNVENRKL